LPISTHEHSYIETARVNATCLEDGYVTYYCAGCGHSYTDILEAPGHIFTPWSRFVMADDAAVEVEIRFCSICGFYELREAEQTAPTEPTNPTNPTDPTAPTEPTNPTDPTDPTEPTNPTNPTEPSEPVTEPTTSEQQDDAPQNFFQKIGAFFRNLFDRIFGLFRR
jgi:cell division septation protein DedD